MASEAPQWKLWLRVFFLSREFVDVDSEFTEESTVVVVAVSIDSDAPDPDPLLKFFRMKFWRRIQHRRQVIVIITFPYKF